MAADGQLALTARQREVITLVRRGLSNGEIAGALGISEDGVKAHLSRLYLRFGVTNRVALLAAVDETSAPVRFRGSTLGQLREIAGTSVERSIGLHAVPAMDTATTQLVTVREALAALEVALDLVRELPAETPGPVLDALRRRIATAVAALDELAVPAASRAARTV